MLNLRLQRLPTRCCRGPCRLRAWLRADHPVMHRLRRSWAVHENGGWRFAFTSGPRSVTASRPSSSGDHRAVRLAAGWPAWACCATCWTVPGMAWDWSCRQWRR